MSTLRAVRRRIISVKKIQKIAGALEVVALTRLRGMEAETLTSRAYFERIRQMLFDLSAALSFTSHPLLMGRRQVKAIGLIAIFSDKGLCGNFNANVDHRLTEFISAHKGQQIKAAVIGQKGSKYFKRIPDCQLLSRHPALDRKTQTEGVLEIASSLIDKFLSGEIDRIFLLYSKFRLHLLGEAKALKLLPLVLDQASPAQPKAHRDYIYEPGAYEIFDRLIREYLANQIHQGILESRCAEEMSRMLAMKMATDNADEMIVKLSLMYNKARQTQITKELTEVVSAAEAIV